MDPGCKRLAPLTQLHLLHPQLSASEPEVPPLAKSWICTWSHLVKLSLPNIILYLGHTSDIGILPVHITSFCEHLSHYHQHCLIDCCGFGELVK